MQYKKEKFLRGGISGKNWALQGELGHRTPDGPATAPALKLRRSLGLLVLSHPATNYPSLSLLSFPIFLSSIPTINFRSSLSLSLSLCLFLSLLCPFSTSSFQLRSHPLTSIPKILSYFPSFSGAFPLPSWHPLFLLLPRRERRDETGLENQSSDAMGCAPHAGHTGGERRGSTGVNVTLLGDEGEEDVASRGILARFC